MGEVSEAQVIVLRDIFARPVDIRLISEPYRQKAIDMAMMEPALVDIDADRLFITEAGIALLRAKEAGNGQAD